MSLFVDASALVAIIAGEPEGEAFMVDIQREELPLWSPMSCWETVSSLRRSYGWAVERARLEVERVATAAGLSLVVIGAAELATALDAYQAFGKGHHPARLNMGDCFAYACAKANGARLLYKGNDFIHTDLT